MAMQSRPLLIRAKAATGNRAMRRRFRSVLSWNFANAARRRWTAPANVFNCEYLDMVLSMVFGAAVFRKSVPVREDCSAEAE